MSVEVACRFPEFLKEPVRLQVGRFVDDGSSPKRSEKLSHSEFYPLNLPINLLINLLISHLELNMAQRLRILLNFHAPQRFK